MPGPLFRNTKSLTQKKSHGSFSHIKRGSPAVPRVHDRMETTLVIITKVPWLRYESVSLQKVPQDELATMASQLQVSELMFK
ncbi:hypothetical protein NPIL_303091 [Nephila pilipes]|uniref:Uncharacterized protein n=1 Tax=Nephila pilipes TaxID=299642 RepID=A0A8X6QMN8_NEPPI|nr:hypothetical protein NPIL_303091 [Nephila pilipes]